MAKLIRRGRITAEAWPLLEADPQDARGGLVLERQLIPLALWLGGARDRTDLPRDIGVVLPAEADPAQIDCDLHRLPVVAVAFARFSDGRGYSIARLLRQRYGYAGEIRAIGDVLRDQLFYLKRVGFDAFQLRDDQDAEDALRALNDFSESYQAGADQPLPLFRRRAA